MMNENRKTERVRVLGVQVDAMRVDRAINLTNRYLEKHKFEYIVFANTPAALSGQQENLLKEYVDNAALVLPGDGNIEDAAEVRKWLKDGISYQAEYFRKLFTRLNKQYAGFYVMAEKEEQLTKIRKIVKEKYNRLQMEDILWQEEESVDCMLNGINSLSPDILFICGNHERISGFLREHGCKINAGLCFCMEEIVTDQATEITEWPVAEGAHRAWEKMGGWISRIFHDHLFKKQMKQELKNTEPEQQMKQPVEMNEKE